MLRFAVTAARLAQPGLAEHARIRCVAALDQIAGRLPSRIPTQQVAAGEHSRADNGATSSDLTDSVQPRRPANCIGGC